MASTTSLNLLTISLCLSFCSSLTISSNVLWAFGSHFSLLSPPRNLICACTFCNVLLSFLNPSLLSCLLAWSVISPILASASKAFLYLLPLDSTSSLIFGLSMIVLFPFLSTIESGSLSIISKACSYWPVMIRFLIWVAFLLSIKVYKDLRFLSTLILSCLIALFAFCV